METTHPIQRAAMLISNVPGAKIGNDAKGRVVFEFVPPVEPSNTGWSIFPKRPFVDQNKLQHERIQKLIDENIALKVQADNLNTQIPEKEKELKIEEERVSRLKKGLKITGAALIVATGPVGMYGSAAIAGLIGTLGGSAVVLSQKNIEHEKNESKNETTQNNQVIENISTLNELVEKILKTNQAFSLTIESLKNRVTLLNKEIEQLKGYTVKTIVPILINDIASYFKKEEAKEATPERREQPQRNLDNNHATEGSG